MRPKHPVGNREVQNAYFWDPLGMIWDDLGALSSDLGIKIAVYVKLGRTRVPKIRLEFSVRLAGLEFQLGFSPI